MYIQFYQTSYAIPYCFNATLPFNISFNSFLFRYIFLDLYICLFPFVELTSSNQLSTQVAIAVHTHIVLGIK